MTYILWYLNGAWFAKNPFLQLYITRQQNQHLKLNMYKLQSLTNDPTINCQFTDRTFKSNHISNEYIISSHIGLGLACVRELLYKDIVLHFAKFLTTTKLYPRPLHPSLSSTSRLSSPSRSPFISADIESGSSIFCVRNTQKQTNIAQQSHKKGGWGCLGDSGGGGVKQTFTEANKQKQGGQAI